MFLVVATLLMVIEKLVAHFSSIENVYDDVQYRYTDFDGNGLPICNLQSQKPRAAESKYDSLQYFLFLILLGLPVIPILGSFIVSIYKLWDAQKKEGNLRSNSNEKSKHRQATITVIIVTGIYILCNIPVFILRLSNVISLSADLTALYNCRQKDECDPKANSVVSKTFLSVWPILYTASYTLLVAINSALNPIVYFTRMNEFRVSVIKQKNTISRFMRKGDSVGCEDQEPTTITSS